MAAYCRDRGMKNGAFCAWERRFAGSVEAGRFVAVGVKSQLPMTSIRRSLFPYLPGLCLLGLAAWNAFKSLRNSPRELSWVILALLGAGLLFVGHLIAKVIWTVRNLYSGPNTYRAATVQDLAKLDQSFYQYATTALKKEGYRYVDDVVNVTASNSWPKNHAVLRHFIGDEGATMCAIYHLRLYGFVALVQRLNGNGDRLKIVESETELNDGTFVTTANNAEAERTTGYSFQDRLQLPLVTAPEVVARQHRTHLASVLHSKPPGTLPVRIFDAFQLQESQNRLHLKKCEFRKSAGFSRPSPVPIRNSPRQAAISVTLPNPPRRVRLRPGGFRRVWFPRLLLIPFQLAGLFLIQFVLVYAATQIFGSDFPARIVSVQPSPREANRYNVKFVYNVGDGTLRTGKGAIAPHNGIPPSIGDRIMVRKLAYWALGPAVLSGGPSSLAGLACVALFTTVWCGLIGIASVALWLNTFFDKRLVRNGHATSGIITQKTQIQRGRNTRLELHYRFQSPNGADVFGKQIIGPPAFRSLQENQPVTVLYRATYPEISLVYEASAYEWASDRASK